MCDGLKIFFLAMQNLHWNTFMKIVFTFIFHPTFWAYLIWRFKPSVQENVPYYLSNYAFVFHLFDLSLLENFLDLFLTRVALIAVPFLTLALRNKLIFLIRDWQTMAHDLFLYGLWAKKVLYIF